MINQKNGNSKWQHWEHVYNTRDPESVGWFQKVPEPSLHLIKKSSTNKSVHILDVGGGDSLLVDHLLIEGYTHISVLDISLRALEKAQDRLGLRSTRVNWILADITSFNPVPVDLWHDRAAFHFLTTSDDVRRYVCTAASSVRQGGTLIVGTFSVQGPTKCSGLPVKQYSAWSLEQTFAPYFVLEESLYINHKTPNQALQNYLFGCFRRTDIRNTN